MALPKRIAQPEPTARPVAVPPSAPWIRRCTFRRLSRVGTADGAEYEVSCMYPDRRLPLPLGDLETGVAVCTGCVADHVFRPDED